MNAKTYALAQRKNHEIYESGSRDKSPKSSYYFSLVIGFIDIKNCHDKSKPINSVQHVNNYPIRRICL